MMLKVLSLFGAATPAASLVSPSSSVCGVSVVPDGHCELGGHIGRRFWSK